MVRCRPLPPRLPTIPSISFGAPNAGAMRHCYEYGLDFDPEIVLNIRGEIEVERAPREIGVKTDETSSLIPDFVLSHCLTLAGILAENLVRNALSEDLQDRRNECISFAGLRFSNQRFVPLLIRLLSLDELSDALRITQQVDGAQIRLCRVEDVIDHS